ncbi:MAG: NAD(+) synthase [Clostridiales bacterium]|nr:NAD(+) synthase [Clostridiales bacterium]
MDTLIRTCAASPAVVPGDPQACLISSLDVISQGAAVGADLIVLPALSLSGASCGSLLNHRMVLDGADRALSSLARKTAHINAYIIAGLPAYGQEGPASMCAVINRGRILDLIPCVDAPSPLLGHAPRATADPGAAGPYSLYRCGSLRFCVLSCAPEHLAWYAPEAVRKGAQLIVAPCCTPIRAGDIARYRSQMIALTKALGCAVLFINGGLGETSSPSIYRSFSCLVECGKELAFQSDSRQPFLLNADVDTDIISAQRTCPVQTPGSFGVGSLTPGSKSRLLRKVERNPFLPSGYTESQEYLEELFSLQSEALAVRIQKTGLHKLILGVSGGVDSTLALLVCAKALDSLGIDRHNLVGVTMPGFGTTDRTYLNSLSLIDNLGAQKKEISIKKSVLQHFDDIQQDPSLHDVTYENAQARERTQILFDLANQTGGLVVGTGDLSEAALGWCTFGGDQLSSFNVNASITKNVARSIIRQQAESKEFFPVREALLDVLDTPVSPELLPPSISGEIHQKTEDILGPYELHEFFLYYFVHYQMAPSKILLYACAAFEETYSPEEIRSTLRIFLQRFFAGQFKRSCSPDSAALCDVALGVPFFTIPSDASCQAMLDELNGAALPF